MRTIVASLLALLCLTATQPAAAAESPNSTASRRLSIGDLSRPNESVFEAEEGTIVDFEVANMVPSKRYKIKLESKEIETKPLTLSPGAAVAAAAPSSCQTRIIEPLKEAESEDAVGLIIAEANTIECGGTDKDVRDVLISRSRYPLPSWTVKRGQMAILTVERLAADGKVDKTWRYEISGGVLGSWTTTYGFNFIPNGDKRFQTVQDSNDSGAFTIAELEDREDLDFAPSIFFNWRPKPDQKAVARRGPVFGLGFDLDEPIVFAGYGFDVGQNFTFTLGGVLHKESRLAGKYVVGQSVNESLDEAQLEEKTYDAAFFFGFAFRFDKNPFKTGDDSKGE